MTLYVFGKQDLLSLPPPPSIEISQSGLIHYTSPTHNRFYSRYGFAFPIDYEGIPLDLIMDGEIPRPTDHVSHAKALYTFLLIDHHGTLWSLRVGPHEETAFAKGQSYIDRSGDGWWLKSTDDVQDDQMNDIQMLKGYLYTNPSTADIDRYWFKYMGAKTRTWVSIRDIVERLNSDFPKPKTVNDLLGDL